MIKKIVYISQRIIHYFGVRYYNMDERSEWLEDLVWYFQKWTYPLAIELDKQYGSKLTDIIDHHGYITREMDTYVQDHINSIWERFESRMTRDSTETIYDSDLGYSWVIPDDIAYQYLDQAENDYCSWISHVKCYESTIKSRNWLQKILHIPDIYQELLDTCEEGIRHCQIGRAHV